MSQKTFPPPEGWGERKRRTWQGKDKQNQEAEGVKRKKPKTRKITYERHQPGGNWARLGCSPLAKYQNCDPNTASVVAFSTLLASRRP